MEPSTAKMGDLYLAGTAFNDIETHFSWIGCLQLYLNTI
jgi:hypothetical protein